MQLQVDAGFDATGLDEEIHRSYRKRTYDESLPTGRIDFAIDAAENRVFAVGRFAEVDIAAFHTEPGQKVEAHKRLVARFLLIEVERVLENTARAVIEVGSYLCLRRRLANAAADIKAGVCSMCGAGNAYRRDQGPNSLCHPDRHYGKSPGTYFC